MGARDAYGEVLAIRDARALIAASATSELGDWLYNAALLGYIYSTTGSAAWVGAATVCRLLPYALFGPLGGVVADRYDRRTVLVVGDVLRCITMVVLAAVVAADGAVVIVIALTALASASGTAERPAAMALLPRMVGESSLGPANALLHTVQDLGVVIGPAIGAVLLAVASPSIAFVVNALTFALSAVLVAMIRRQPSSPRTTDVPSIRSELVGGVQTARATPFIVPLFLVVAMVEFTYGAQTVQLVLYADSVLDLGPSGYGYLLAAAGVGGLLSVLVNARFTTSAKVSLIVVVTGALFCATQLVYAGSEIVVVALLATVVGGLGFVACEVIAETALARVASREYLGRTMGVYDALTVIAMIGGALIAPVLIDLTSLRTSFVALGVLSVVITFGCLLGLRGLDALSRRQAETLASRVAVVEKLSLTTGSSRLVVEQLASAAQIFTVPGGVDIVVQGAPSHAFYAIVDGSVLVHRDGADIAHLGSGEHFGERGLLDRAPRNASVTTEGESTLLRIDGDVLLSELAASPTLFSALDRSDPLVTVAAPPSDSGLVDDTTWSPT